jgi:outer membrane lipoprotein LolB
MRLALVGLGLALTACAHKLIVDDGLDARSRQAAFAAISDWNIRGRISVDDGERGYQGQLRWRQRGERMELVVSGPLGARSFRVEGTQASLSVTSRGETEVLADPERQLSDMLGWWLPVTSVEHWLLGQADPEFAAQPARGDFDTLTSLNQREWQIRYEQYQLAENLVVPREIRLTHRSLEVTLTITDYESIVAEP